jgi:hypothetical protein
LGFHPPALSEPAKQRNDARNTTRIMEVKHDSGNAFRTGTWCDSGQLHRIIYRLEIEV